MTILSHFLKPLALSWRSRPFTGSRPHQIRSHYGMLTWEYCRVSVLVAVLRQKSDCCGHIFWNIHLQALQKHTTSQHTLKGVSPEEAVGSNAPLHACIQVSGDNTGRGSVCIFITYIHTTTQPDTHNITLHTHNTCNKYKHTYVCTQIQ